MSRDIYMTPGLSSFWDYFEVTPRKWYVWNFDGAEVFLCREKDHWKWAAHARFPHQIHPIFQGPELLKTLVNENVFVSVAGTQNVALRPEMLDRPFMVHLDTPLTIVRNEEATYNLHLPVSVALKLENGETLARPNTILLKKTWFGDTSDGTLCYLWPVDLTDRFNGDYRSLVRCEIKIRNTSKNNVTIKQFAVYSELLSIWESNGKLVTNSISLETLGDGTLKMNVIPQVTGPDEKLLHDAEVGMTELLIKRGVSFLKNIAGIVERA